MTLRPPTSTFAARHAELRTLKGMGGELPSHRLCVIATLAEMAGLGKGCTGFTAAFVLDEHCQPKKGSHKALRLRYGDAFEHRAPARAPAAPSSRLSRARCP